MVAGRIAAERPRVPAKAIKSNKLKASSGCPWHSVLRVQDYNGLQTPSSTHHVSLLGVGRPRGKGPTLQSPPGDLKHALLPRRTSELVQATVANEDLQQALSSTPQLPGLCAI